MVSDVVVEADWSILCSRYDLLGGDRNLMQVHPMCRTALMCAGRHGRYIEVMLRLGRVQELAV